jgi:hypothetical protein
MMAGRVAVRSRHFGGFFLNCFSPPKPDMGLLQSPSQICGVAVVAFRYLLIAVLCLHVSDHSCMDVSYRLTVLCFPFCNSRCLGSAYRAVPLGSLKSTLYYILLTKRGSSGSGNVSLDCSCKGCTFAWILRGGIVTELPRT